MAGIKVCQCVFCGVDVEVTKFATPAKVRCEEHKDQKICKDIVDIQQSPLAVAVCPQDPSHYVEMKKWVNGYHGSVVTHQCHDCLIIISYSTQHKKILLQTSDIITRNGSVSIESEIDAVSSWR